MQLGWIDFSKEDKSNAMNIIHSLNEPGVLDELGFGAIRNAFANDFFPGTSTLHTRSKYFYLIPYMLFEFQKKYAEGKEIAHGNPAAFIKKIRKDIDDEEKKTKNLLMKVAKDSSEIEGVIGSSKDDEKYWVERTPIVIYWSGLRTFGFFENSKYSTNYTYSELLADFYRIAQNKSNSKSAATDSFDEQNDSDAGGSVYYPISKDFHNPKWRDNINIGLTKKEAKDLRKRIISNENSKNSLLAFILKEDLNLKNLSFKDFTEAYKTRFPAEIKEKLDLANAVNEFYYLIMLRYNYLLAKADFENCNIDVRKQWEEIEPLISQICTNFNLEKTFLVMKIQNKNLRDFLRNLKTELPKASATGDYSVVDLLITNREKSLKTTRAKINHPDKYDVKKLLTYERFDYRFNNVQKHVQDIQEGENNA
ncbi:hypothetical protein DYE49_05945 [Treponema rectale]|uniref:Uncharacterized protein n=1 Tax=Treponema rectale TaxID=744512 RepID=A0A840SFR7_9SPIR|nr:DUF6361 family protein [Treponema rectale]MBB5218281.1 hypothetical protein [Treponema rectale]QOS40016.1 hypothetical protein DYE49_05945 [Treponema rectale]